MSIKPIMYQLSSRDLGALVDTDPATLRQTMLDALHQRAVQEYLLVQRLRRNAAAQQLLKSDPYLNGTLTIKQAATEHLSALAELLHDTCLHDDKLPAILDELHQRALDLYESSRLLRLW